MWFKSARNFKENSEDKALLFTITMQTLNSFGKVEDYENHQSRGLFIDEFLNEEKVNVIKIPINRKMMELETLLDKMEKLNYLD